MNEKVQADIARFRGMLQHISASYKHISDEAIEDYVADIEAILADECNIEDQLPAIACGAFKECYGLNDDFVIKFASECNDTNSEEALLHNAVEAEVAEIFLPTWYCYLDSRGPSLFMLDEEASAKYYYDYENHTYVDNPDYTSQRADCIIIQPRILRTVSAENYLTLPRNGLDYDKAPIVDAKGNKIDFRTAYDFCVSSQTWLQDIMDTYGFEFFNRLAQFLKDNDVHDLHTDNIGYYVRKDGKVAPVIFDCLSSSW